MRDPTELTEHEAALLNRLVVAYPPASAIASTATLTRWRLY